ncbi:unnamed protein product [Ectocarpus sp. CCAP 1310/34]|nr:unnamed protein product [Ectocarpus sp. CCAP 1310/34]
MHTKAPTLTASFHDTSLLHPSLSTCVLPGETPVSKPLTASPETVEVPEALVLAVRTAIGSGASINPKKMMDWEENAYLAGRVLEVIAVEDRASGADVTTAGRRKSKYCVPLAVELMVAERFRERLAASRTQLSRTELDNKETGTSGRNVVTHLKDHEHITAAQIDPNIVHQPDISYDKFMNMVKEVNKDYRDCHQSRSLGVAKNGTPSAAVRSAITARVGGVLLEKRQWSVHASGSLVLKCS